MVEQAMIWAGSVGKEPIAAQHLATLVHFKVLLLTGFTMNLLRISILEMIIIFAELKKYIYSLLDYTYRKS